VIRYALLLLLLAAPGLAEDTVPVVPTPAKPPIVFPALPPSGEPVTIPPVQVDPEAVPKLAYGQIYVVQSDVEFTLLASPEKLVTITPVAGPVTVRGVFADGNGKVETRTFKAPFVAFVDANEGASGRVELLGVIDRSNITRQLIDIGAGPRPPPLPPPGPGPTPAPTGFRVLFIYNSTANLSREQYNILFSTKIVDYLNTHCVKAGPQNIPEWRKWSPKVNVTEKESKTMVDLWNSIDHAKIADKLPQIVIAVNGQAETFALPATEADTIALLKTKGGE
jgi:hypothetical protein